MLWMETTPGRGRSLKCKLPEKPEPCSPVPGKWQLVPGPGRVSPLRSLSARKTFTVIGLSLALTFLLGLIKCVHCRAVTFTNDPQAVGWEMPWKLGNQGLLASLPPRPILVPKASICQKVAFVGRSTCVLASFPLPQHILGILSPWKVSFDTLLEVSVTGWLTHYHRACGEAAHNVRSACKTESTPSSQDWARKSQEETEVPWSHQEHTSNDLHLLRFLLPSTSAQPGTKPYLTQLS